MSGSLHPFGWKPPRTSPFRAEAIRHLERPLAAKPPLLRPMRRWRWAGIGVVLLGAAVLLAGYP
ncbi:hypothetical protein [uncultured Aureimonas sp.]|uniref:hypothetical protein n=1 Tax=uncultured Aureimonas sp. TaxID=1604662 RepID=UPI0025E927BA|nr:hypothetical protein [uncultured Aureimonas sp.]